MGIDRQDGRGRHGASDAGLRMVEKSVSLGSGARDHAEQMSAVSPKKQASKHCCHTSLRRSVYDETWRAPVAKYFRGEIIVGKDLMVV